MKLYPDCDYFNDKRDSKYAPDNGDCEECYRWSTCIYAFMKGRTPIPIEELHNYVGKKIWVQSPGIPKYGRVAIAEDINEEKHILWLKDDFTCHQYGEVWEAYEFWEEQ
ncbi:MAG: hypothetical protein NC489_11595 [Ruminococcus flavefaciens]|nr:hypothetical protein [Ruminococcus flavefaciens]